VEKQRSDAVPSQRHKQSAASCHLEIGPKPVDDTFTLNFAEWLRKESYDVGDKWYYQQDNELYTSAMLSIYRAVLSVDKTKLAMDLNRFSVNFICMFTNNVVLRNGAYYCFK
jgi:hypothetical protein